MVLYTTVLLIIQGESFWLRLKFNSRGNYSKNPPWARRLFSGNELLTIQFTINYPKLYILYIVRFKYIVLGFGGHTYSSTGQTLHLQGHRIGATQLGQYRFSDCGGYRTPGHVHIW